MVVFADMPLCRQRDYATFHQNSVHARTEQDASYQGCVFPPGRIELLLALVRLARGRSPCSR